jgi:hypothetical protein
MLCVTECGVEVTSHRLAAACGSPATVEQVVVALTALADSFLELYADTAATPVSWTLRETAELTLDDGP